MMSATDFEAERDRLLEQIAREAKETASWTGRDEISPAVMAAIRQVPRESFVAPGDEIVAYVNRPLGIGFGQTISQPFIVAIMTELLEVASHHHVLEIGTGSGYQAAVLACLVEQVYSVEVIPGLAETARRRLAELGFDNVEVRTGDGRDGWPEAAPFERIIVTAAGEDVPRDLIQQLAPGGRMVIPVGAAGGTQILTVGTKDGDGRFTTEPGLPVAFVPLVHGERN
jgi:protein-L-isoaspartate(D-aspartate) O-methyltransferase